MFDLLLEHVLELALTIVSFISIFVSLRPDRFTAAFRLTGARVELIGLLSETASNHARSSSLYQRVSSKAKKSGHAEVPAMVEKGDAMMAKLDASAKRIYELTQDVLRSGRLEEYQRIVPEMRRLRDQSIRLHVSIQGIDDAYRARGRLAFWAPLCSSARGLQQRIAGFFRWRGSRNEA